LVRDDGEETANQTLRNFLVNRFFDFFLNLPVLEYQPDRGIFSGLDEETAPREFGGCWY
jgi:hypothetical protein